MAQSLAGNKIRQHQHSGINAPVGWSTPQFMEPPTWDRTENGQLWYAKQMWQQSQECLWSQQFQEENLVVGGTDYVTLELGLQE